MFERLQADYQRFREVESALSDPDVATDPARVASLAKERGTLAKVALPYGRYLDLGRQIAEARKLIETEADEELRAYAEAEREALESQREEAAESLRDLIYDRESGVDRPGLIMEVRAGTGGDEAALFARDLVEMYRRYAEAKGWAFEVLELVPTELGGFKEASFSINGDGAFRHLQFESGGHRVQRVPATETQGRIHTSLATVAVLAEPEEVEIDIRPEDIRDGRDARRRPRRPAPEQDRKRRPSHAPSDRRRRHLPRRAEPAQEPRQGHAIAPQPSV